jgi:ribosomal-protein-alanine N-acetyltransferase
MREIKQEDIVLLSFIHRNSFAKGWSESDIEGLLGEYTHGYIVDEKAFVLFNRIENQIEILTLCTMPEARRKGYAKELMQRIIDNNIGAEIFLEVAVSRIPAINLYNSLGFSEIGIRKGYYNGEDAISMCLNEVAKMRNFL